MMVSVYFVCRGEKMSTPDEGKWPAVPRVGDTMLISTHRTAGVQSHSVFVVESVLWQKLENGLQAGVYVRPR
jgi:hypothetical protein